MGYVKVKPGIGVGRQGCRSVKRDTKRIVDPTGLCTDIGNLSGDFHPFSAAQKIAVQPRCVQVQPIKTGDFRAKAIAVQFFFNHGGGDTQLIRRSYAVILCQGDRPENSGSAQPFGRA